jgi:hypothetical protein
VRLLLIGMVKPYTKEYLTTDDGVEMTKLPATITYRDAAGEHRQYDRTKLALIEADGEVIRIYKEVAKIA